MDTATRRARAAERKASAARIAAEQAKTNAIVATGKCPECSRKLRRNSSITGWWQCSQFGAVGLRAEADKPPCNWQGFTS